MAGYLYKQYASTRIVFILEMNVGGAMSDLTALNNLICCVVLCSVFFCFMITANIIAQFSVSVYGFADVFEFITNFSTLILSGI